MCIVYQCEPKPMCIVYQCEPKPMCIVYQCEPKPVFSCVLAASYVRIAYNTTHTSYSDCRVRAP